MNKLLIIEYENAIITIYKISYFERDKYEQDLGKVIF